MSNLSNLSLVQNSQQPRFAYIKFGDRREVEIGQQHLANTVFLNRPTRVPAGLKRTVNRRAIPDEETALQSSITALPGQRQLPPHISNQLQDMGDGQQMIVTNDPNLTALGLPAYPPLPPTTEPVKVEEIRRTVYIGNLPKGCDGEELLNFFNACIGEVMYLRMAAGNEFLPCDYAYVEFSQQSSVPLALQNSDSLEFQGRPLRIQHSKVAIIKPQRKAADRALYYYTPEELETKQRIKAALKQIMQSMDLDIVTSRDIRRRLCDQISVELRRYKDFIDRQMLIILGQLDAPSKIFDYLYLGTEWNASNWEELNTNGVQYILNVTKEVDNFFPAQFTYLKIWVSDEASTELLLHWQRTYYFIKRAKQKGAKVLVHCKKGISRSASTVVAYAMKEYGWDLEEALDHVKRKRDCITPNPGFMDQLSTFYAMLQASSHRHSAVFNAG